MKSNVVVIIIILVALSGGLGFFGGVSYQKSKRIQPSFSQFQNGTQRQNANNARAGFGGRPLSGEITAVDGDTITVKSQDGSNKIVVISESTKINKSSVGSKDDLKVGENAMVIGTEEITGTVNAQTISVGGNLFLRAPNP